MTEWYNLKHRKPVPYGVNIIENPEKFARLNTKHFRKNRKIRRTYIGDVYVSTIFLGLDNYMGVKEPHEPVLFETMIFGGEHDNYQTRCCTHREALKMHWQAVEVVKND